MLRTEDLNANTACPALFGIFSVEAACRSFGATGDEKSPRFFALSWAPPKSSFRACCSTNAIGVPAEIDQRMQE